MKWMSSTTKHITTPPEEDEAIGSLSITENFVEFGVFRGMRADRQTDMLTTIQSNYCHPIISIVQHRTYPVAAIQ